MTKRTKTAQPTKKAERTTKKVAQPNKAKTAAKVEKTAAAPDTALSKAVSKTWKDAAVRKARTTRSGCKVGNKVYGSVREAFVDQGWPLGIHQRIRLIVKTEGAAEVEGKKITLVKE
jgi:hypothetical protein